MHYGSAEEHGTSAYVACLNSAFMNFPIMWKRKNSVDTKYNKKF